MVEGSHHDCVQNEHRSSLDILRRNIRLKQCTGCFNCGHMQAMRPNRGKKGGCMQPWLVWHVAWTAYYRDLDMGYQMIASLGKSIINDKLDDSVLWNYCRWLGEETTLFDRLVSNMGRPLHYWIDRLESHCMQS